jgi:hypothetical protein
MTDSLAKETFTCPFFVDKVLGDFDMELVEKRPKKRARGTFLRADNCTTHLVDDDFNRLGIRRLLIHLIAPILHPVTSGYLEP